LAKKGVVRKKRRRKSEEASKQTEKKEGQRPGRKYENSIGYRRLKVNGAYGG
jgi:hypothetical protein